MWDVQKYQAQFTLKSKSPQIWLRYIQSAETLCNKFSDINLSE